MHQFTSDHPHAPLLSFLSPTYSEEKLAVTQDAFQEYIADALASDSFCSFSSMLNSRGCSHLGFLDMFDARYARNGWWIYDKNRIRSSPYKDLESILIQLEALPLKPTATAVLSMPLSFLWHHNRAGTFGSNPAWMEAISNLQASMVHTILNHGPLEVQADIESLSINMGTLSFRLLNSKRSWLPEPSYSALMSAVIQRLDALPDRRTYLAQCETIASIEGPPGVIDGVLNASASTMLSVLFQPPRLAFELSSFLDVSDIS
jgi:hypothetical protein